MSFEYLVLSFMALMLRIKVIGMWDKQDAVNLVDQIERRIATAHRGEWPERPEAESGD